MTEIISQILGERDLIKSNYSDLFDANKAIVPIPFFGNIKKAKVITIGANPSSTELNNNWSEQMDASQINNKLENYFNDNPHKWFSTWEKALNTIGYSYYNGSAAHTDLCPWATKSISALCNNGKCDKVLELFKKELHFFGNIINSIKPNFVFLAGTLTNKYYLNEFLFDFGEMNNCELLEEPKRISPAPFFNRHKIKIQNKEIDALFISVSPSAGENKKNQLIELVDKFVNNKIG